MKTKLILLLVLSAVIGLSLGYLSQFLPRPGYVFKGALIEPPIPAKEFSLLDQHGQTFTLGEQRGKVVLLFFGYTSCPDVCPATLGKYKQIATLLGDQAVQVEFVMITADPERDTAERLKNYLGGFNPAFIGLHGPEPILRVVYSSYFVAVERQEKEAVDPTAGYLVAHTSRVFLIDQGGNLRLTYPPEIGAEAMAQDIGYLLKRQAGSGASFPLLADIEMAASRLFDMQLRPEWPMGGMAYNPEMGYVGGGGNGRIKLQPVRMLFPVYEGTLEARIVDLMGSKMLAAQVFYGDSVGEALVEEGADADLLGELVRAALGEVQVGRAEGLFRLEGESWTAPTLEPAVNGAAPPPLVDGPAFLVADPIVRRNLIGQRRRSQTKTLSNGQLSLFD